MDWKDEYEHAQMSIKVMACYIISLKLHSYPFSAIPADTTRQTLLKLFFETNI